MNDIKIFESSEFGAVRTLNINGVPYFVGKDVAVILGYSNPQKAIRDHIDNEDVTVNELFTVNGTMGALINESGLYSLILSSKLPKAKAFKHWVTSEVLPSIRKHGVYAVDDLINNPDAMIKALTALKEERSKTAALSQQIEQDKPKVLFADSVSAAKTSILIGDLAKLITQNGYEIGQKRLFAWLREHGYLIKSGNSKNMPTQRATEMGLFEVKISTVNNPDGSIRETKTTKVTGKGQIYFVNKFVGDDKAVG